MESKPKFKPDSRLKLMDQVRQVLRYHHYSYRTEKTYCDWILRYVKYHGGKTHPNSMGKKEVEGFLSHLATRGKVSALLRNPSPGEWRQYPRRSGIDGACGCQDYRNLHACDAKGS